MQNDIISHHVFTFFIFMTGDPSQEYTLELSTNPSYITTSDNGGHHSITVQIMDTCSSFTQTNKNVESEIELLNLQNNSLTVHTIHINSLPNQSTTTIASSALAATTPAATTPAATTSPTVPSSSFNSLDAPLSLWNTTLTVPVVHHLQIRTYDNIVQNKKINKKHIEDHFQCLLRHFITPTNGNYDKWDVALVVGSRDRVKWQHPAVADSVSSSSSFTFASSLPSSFAASYGNDDRDTGFAQAQPHAVIDVPILLEDDESNWITTKNVQLLSTMYLILFLFSAMIRISSILYWKLFDSFDLRDLNNEAYNRCLEVNVAGTRHPAAMIGAQRFYSQSCLWTYVSLLFCFNFPVYYICGSSALELTPTTLQYCVYDTFRLASFNRLLYWEN